MLNTEGIFNTELGCRFLEAEWLTEQHMDELIDNVPTKKEMEADNAHHSTPKCKSSFQDKCVRLFPIGRGFAKYMQLEHYGNLFF